MKKELRIGLIFVTSVALAGILFLTSAGSNARATNTTTSSQTAAATQSVSGTIASVEKSAFTLTVGQQKSNVSGYSSTPSQTAKTMTFQVDQNTTIDGKLKVGANADVTYRQENGSNSAISVRVS